MANSNSQDIIDSYNSVNFFDLIEDTIKLLLRSYFSRFSTSKKLDTCEKMGISTKKIPKDYIMLADLYENCNLKFISKNSLLYPKISPKDEKNIYFKDIESGLTLTLVDEFVEWDESIFKIESDKKILKEYMGNLINGVIFVFKNMKLIHNELRTIELKIDTKNITIYLVDSIFSITYPIRIGCKIIFPEI